MEKLKIAIYSMIQKFRFFPEILHFGDEVIPFVNPVIVGFELRHSSK